MRPLLQAADAQQHGLCHAGRMTAETALWQEPPASLALSKSLQADFLALGMTLKEFEVQMVLSPNLEHLDQRTSPSQTQLLGSKKAWKRVQLPHSSLFTLFQNMLTFVPATK